MSLTSGTHWTTAQHVIGCFSFLCFFVDVVGFMRTVADIQMAVNIWRPVMRTHCCRGVNQGENSAVEHAQMDSAPLVVFRQPFLYNRFCRNGFIKLDKQLVGSSDLCPKNARLNSPIILRSTHLTTYQTEWPSTTSLYVSRSGHTTQRSVSSCRLKRH
jgi:hypothetical protein